jgi:F0F1-type ATP synthase delta subunit
MTLSTTYAQALLNALKEHPNKQEAYIQNLCTLLKRRGHEKLLPRIYRELETTALKHRRTEQYTTSTREAERTRILLELYRNLIHSH